MNLAPAFSYQKGISGMNKLNAFYIRTSFVCRKIEDGRPHYRKGQNKPNSTTDRLNLQPIF